MKRQKLPKTTHTHTQNGKIMTKKKTFFFCSIKVNARTRTKYAPKVRRKREKKNPPPPEIQKPLKPQKGKKQKILDGMCVCCTYGTTPF